MKRKSYQYQHLETGSKMTVVAELAITGDHWAITLVQNESENRSSRTPVFYGTSAEQAERQLLKIYEKDYDLLSVEEITDQ
jgi:hypothetical protein